IIALMLDHAPVAAYWTREDGSFSWVNQGACAMLGYTRDEMLALNIFALDPNMTPTSWASNWSDVNALEHSTSDRQHRRQDGILLPVQVNIWHLDVRGERVHFSFVRDLTGQRQAEDLQQNHVQYITALFKDSPVPQLITDPDSMQIIDANRAAETFYGHEQLKGRSMSTIDIPSAGAIRSEMKTASLDRTGLFPVRHRLSSGEIRDVHVYCRPIEKEGRFLSHYTIEDTTPLYAVRDELEGYRNQLERLPIGIYASTPGAAGVITSANDETCKILEVESKADLIGRKASDFHPDTASRAQLSELILEHGELRKFDIELVTARGRRIWACLSLRCIATVNGDVFFEGAIQDITHAKLAEKEREAALARLHNTLDAAPIPIMLHRTDGMIEEVNSVWCSLTGYGKDELLTINDWTRLAYGDSAPEVLEHIRRLPGERGSVAEGDYVIHCKDGSTRVWAFYSSSLESPETPNGLLISTAIDVTEERSRQRLARQAEAIVQSAAEGITVTGPDRNIQRVNPAFTRITGYGEAEVIGKNPSLLSSGRQDGAFYTRMWHEIDQLGHWQGEIWNRRKNGEVYPEWLSISAIHDPKGPLINYAAVFTDLTELKQFQSSLQSLQRFDPLTGLANKATLLDAIEVAIQAAAGQPEELALLVCGLDRFHLINETFGHQVGDSILKQLAKQMKLAAGSDAVIARIGGDHFALLAPNSINAAALDDLLRRLRSITALSFAVEAGKPVYVSFSTGVARYPSDAQSATDLLRGAETAMFQAKRENPGLHTFFDGTRTETAQKRLLLEIDLRRAIESGQIDVFFQPVVSVADNRVIGAEGLARWDHHE
ncbi:MAG: PAS domain S-box protein, partial [Chromatocurvus sp.]